MLDSIWPGSAIKPRPTGPDSDPYIRSYVRMRFAIGLLGFLLPPLLVFLEPILFDGQPYPRGSLSAYYYSGVRELFVGMLCAIGVFLVIYKIADRTREGRLSTYAGAAVIVVALFPTGKPGKGVEPTPLQSLLGEEWVEGIHFGFAGAFIFFLGLICLTFGRHRHERRSLHRACAVVIGVALALAVIAGATGEPDKGILIAEFVAVWAFAISWLATVERNLLFGGD